MDVKLDGRVVDEELRDVRAEVRVRALGVRPKILFSGELSRGRLNQTVSLPATAVDNTFALELKVGERWLPLTRPTRMGNERVSFGTIVQLSTAFEGLEGPQIGVPLRDVEATLSTSADRVRLAEKKVLQLEQQLAARGAVEPVQLSQMWSDVGGQLHRTATELKATSAGVKLGKVTMEVKAVAMQDPTGVKIGLPGVEQLKQLPPGSLSTLVYEFVPSEPAPDQPAHIGVPRVIGYTEPMAKRVLTHAGLFADVAFVASSDAGEVDRVVRQEPPPTTDLAPGSVVVIYMGKQLT